MTRPHRCCDLGSSVGRRKPSSEAEAAAAAALHALPSSLRFSPALARSACLPSADYSSLAQHRNRVGFRMGRPSHGRRSSAQSHPPPAQFFSDGIRRSELQRSEIFFPIFFHSWSLFFIPASTTKNHQSYDNSAVLVISRNHLLS